MSEYFGNSPSTEFPPRFYARHFWIRVVGANGKEFWQTPCGKKQDVYVNIEAGHNMRWCKECLAYRNNFSPSLSSTK